jgi:trigger factor
MQVNRNDLSETEVELTITADQEQLDSIKNHVLTEHFGNTVNVPGFRAGKAPANFIEKHVDQADLQRQFLDEAVNDLYNQAVIKERIRNVDQPEVQIIKFVPFTYLEFKAKVPTLGEITIPDYKKIKLPKPSPKIIKAADIDAVLDSLKKQTSDRKDVNRAAKNGDQIYLDFKGVDEKGNPVSGADAKDYPLVLGSNTFIPGFEPDLIGLKPGESKTFDIVFPKDYQLKALANKKVTFSINIIKVQEIVDPKLDDSFAQKIGPFKTMADLKSDIKKQLTLEETNRNDRDYESALLKAITEKSKLTVPEVLINDEVEKRIVDLRKNLTYRGQTFEEYLGLEDTNEQDYREKVLRPEAVDRLKASIVLSEISEIEKINLTNEEIDQYLELLKARYTDPEMQAELAKPEARRDVASRLVAEKTIKKVAEYSSN